MRQDEKGLWPVEHDPEPGVLGEVFRAAEAGGGRYELVLVAPDDAEGTEQERTDAVKAAGRLPLVVRLIRPPPALPPRPDPPGLGGPEAYPPLRLVSDRRPDGFPPGTPRRFAPDHDFGSEGGGGDVGTIRVFY